MRGVINNRGRASQIRDFRGLKFGTITPTDIDGLIEYQNKCYMFFETKTGSEELPAGQALAFTRLCDDLSLIGKPAILLVTEHYTPVGEDIDFANTVVRKYYYKKKWRNPASKITLREAVDKFIAMYEGII